MLGRGGGASRRGAQRTPGERFKPHGAGVHVGNSLSRRTSRCRSGHRTDRRGSPPVRRWRDVLDRAPRLLDDPQDRGLRADRFRAGGWGRRRRRGCLGRMGSREMGGAETLTRPGSSVASTPAGLTGQRSLRAVLPRAACCATRDQQCGRVGRPSTSACSTSQRAIAVRSCVPVACDPSAGRLAIATASGVPAIVRIPNCRSR
jgi:hypothetical protein